MRGSVRRRLVVLVVGSLIPAACTNGDTPTDGTTMMELSATGPIDISSLRGRIAFSAGSPYEEEIYVINADGTGLRRVTHDPATDFDPTWSGDGARIAYRHQRRAQDLASNIFVINVDGTGATNLTGDDGIIDWGPAWSPDGSVIAWNSNRDAPGGELHGFVMRPDGSGIELLTDDVFFEYPAWSPDGERIAFMSQVAEEAHQYDIFVMDADGSNVRRLTDFRGDDGWPSWSPDGTKILFTSIRDDCLFSRPPDCKTTEGLGEYHTLYVMNADGTDETRVSLAFGQIADWSPDGRYIVFEDFAGMGSGLNVMRPDGSGLTTIPISVPWAAFPDWIA